MGGRNKDLGDWTSPQSSDEDHPAVSEWRDGIAIVDIDQLSSEQRKNLYLINQRLASELEVEFRDIRFRGYTTERIRQQSDPNVPDPDEPVSDAPLAPKKNERSWPPFRPPIVLAEHDEQTGMRIAIDAGDTFPGSCIEEAWLAVNPDVLVEVEEQV